MYHLLQRIDISGIAVGSTSTCTSATGMYFLYNVSKYILPRVV